MTIPVQSPPLKRTSTLLRELIARPDKTIACPGVFDGLSARMALSTNPEALYCTGAGMTSSRLGLADLAFASQDDFVAQAGLIASLSPTTPVISDADTGFGGPAQVARTVTRYWQAGIAGLHIEDQTATKRCGHLLGKTLVSTDEFLIRIRAAVEARRLIPGCDIVIIARSDAAQGEGVESAIARLKAAIKCGADVAMMEGFPDLESIKKGVRELAPAPCLVGMVPNGATPPFTVADGQAMGLKLMFYPAVGLFAASKALLQAYGDLAKRGSDIPTTGTDETFNVKEFYGLLGMADAIHIDKAAGSNEFASL